MNMRCEYCCDICNGCKLLHPSPRLLIIVDECKKHRLCIHGGELEDRYDCLMLQALDGVDW